MKHFRKIWDKEKHDWIHAHKDMNRQDAYELFCKAFPEADVTKTAFFNERSRIGVKQRQTHHFSRKPKELYAEQIKKGYVRIKIAQPSVWISKAKWVYMETHPWEDFSERSNYVFLDGNNRNFSPENVERVPLKIMGVFNLIGGCEYGNPEVTKLRILQAKLKVAQLDVGEKLNLIGRNGNSGRFFIEEHRAKGRAYAARPEVKERQAKNARERMRRLKVENSAKYRAILDYNNEQRKLKRGNK